MKAMFYTNLYIVFKKIKEGMPRPLLPDVNEVDYRKPERELNTIIEQGILKMAKEAQPADTTYITVFENGEYKLSKSDGGNGYMKLFFYGGYKYLFFEYGEYTILINYSRENEDICYRGDIHTWEYLPEKEKLYRIVGGFYMVNTYNAFCNYAERYKHEFPQKGHNQDFFCNAKELLLSCSGLFSVSGGKAEYKGKRGYPQMVTADMKDTCGTLAFTYLILDQLIIIVDCSYTLKPINVTETGVG